MCKDFKIVFLDFLNESRVFCVVVSHVETLYLHVE